MWLRGQEPRASHAATIETITGIAPATWAKESDSGEHAAAAVPSTGTDDPSS